MEYPGYGSRLVPSGPVDTLQTHESGQVHAPTCVGGFQRFSAEAVSRTSNLNEYRWTSKRFITQASLDARLSLYMDFNPLIRCFFIILR